MEILQQEAEKPKEEGENFVNNMYNMSFYTIYNANPNPNISNDCKSKSEVNRFILLDQTQICEIKESLCEIHYCKINDRDLNLIQLV